MHPVLGLQMQDELVAPVLLFQASAQPTHQRLVVTVILRLLPMWERKMRCEESLQELPRPTNCPVLFVFLLKLEVINMVITKDGFI